MGEKGMRSRVLAALRARGLLAADGATTTFGQPAWRPVPAGHEPQTLLGAGTLQRRLVECALVTPAMGEDLCAACEPRWGWLGGIALA
ncbi:MAG: hypothetical protein Q4B91_02750 [Atopobiaceae bacterium]|nr:hypothetical protein [Atopobiaceae bacterium]